MFAAVRSETWDETRLFAKKLIRWVFRGQEDVGWQLTSSLEREYRRCMKEHLADLIYNREWWILRQFQRRAHHFLPSPPGRNDILEWLALIQHHGGPTRLLDFSHSFYVAAFFALERSTTDAAVWAVNLPPLESAISEEASKKEENETIDHINTRHIKAADRFLLGQERTQLVLNVEPERMNERLSIQQGVFLCPCELESSFSSNLASTFGSDEAEFLEAVGNVLTVAELGHFGDYDALKIIIPKRCQTDAVKDLHSMNITAATLFPGLDGFARSLYYHLRATSLEIDV